MAGVALFILMLGPGMCSYSTFIFRYQPSPSTLTPKLGLLVWICHRVPFAQSDLGLPLRDLMFHKDLLRILRLEVANEARIP